MKNTLIAGGVVLAGILGVMTLSGGNPEPNKLQLQEDTDYSTERSYEEFGDRDCGDFSSQAEAQRFFESDGGPSYDPHGLDRDKDGIACESI